MRTGRRKSGSLKIGKSVAAKVSQEERRTRSHRLIVRGAVFESIVPECKDMTDEEAAAFLPACPDEARNARGYLKKTRPRAGKANNPFVQRAHLYTLAGVVRSAEGLSPQQGTFPALRYGGFAATRGCTPCAAYAAISAHPQKQYTRLRVLYYFCGFYYPIQEVIPISIYHL